MVLKMLKTIVWSVFSLEYVTRPHGESAFERSHGKFSFVKPRLVKPTLFLKSFYNTEN